MKRRGFLKTLAVAIPAVALPKSLASKPIEDEKKHKSGVFVLSTPKIMNPGDVFEAVVNLTENCNQGYPISITQKCILYGFNWKDYGGAIEIKLDKLDLNESYPIDEDFWYEYGKRIAIEETDALMKRLARG